MNTLLPLRLCACIVFLGFVAVSSAHAQQILINEFDADQVDTDAAEFVELFDGGAGSTSLDGLVLVFFNGNDDASYLAFDLDGLSTDAEGYFVLCGNAETVANCDLEVEIPTNLIQNGPDAIALYTGDLEGFPDNTPVTTDNLLDAVVYGTSDSDDAELLVLLNAGQPQIDESANGASATESNQRIPNGAGGARNTDMFMQSAPTPGEENVAAPVMVTGIRINEISHGEVDFMGSTSWIELYNASDSEVDVSSLILCDFPTYSVISTLSVLSGNTTIPAGGYLVLDWANLDNDAEVGLYQANAQGSFDDPTLMIDYMQYGSAGHEREGTAVEAGVWTAGEFVELANMDESLQFFTGRLVGASNWVSAPSTPDQENMLPPMGVTDIRINEISHGEVDFMSSTSWVELYNAGDTETDVSGLVLCDFPTYSVISTLTVLSGTTTIPAGGYLVLEWANLDDDAEVGLYQADVGENFDDASLMIDYMQYGSAGHQREVTAVEAGLWTAGEFVGLAVTGESLQFFDNGMIGSGNWTSAPATADAENAIPMVDPADVVINEFDVDQTDTDAAEFVELYGPTGNTSLDGHALVFFNGNNDTSYRAFDLDGFSTDAEGYFVLCGDATMVANCDYEVEIATNLLQNGPDAIALYVGDATDFPDNSPITTENLVDAVVYDTDDADDAELLVLLNEGQPQIDESANGASFSESNQRIPNGAGGARNTDTFVQTLPTPGEENIAAPVVVTGIRINEISHGEVDFMGSTSWIELYNAGDSETDVSNLILCDFPTYSVISTLSVLSGNTTIPAGGYLVLEWANLDEDAEVGLYQANATGDFVNADLIIDYMQYGSAGHEREGVAVEAGVWTAGEFVELATTGESLQFFDNSMVGSGNWTSAPATAGDENAEPVVGVTDIRINEVSHGEIAFMESTNWVELYNAGDMETDVSNLILCDFPTYAVISTLTVLSGSTTIPAGGYLVLEWANLDDDAEVGLYQANATGNFGNADLMIDYMQYGSAGHERESVAVEAGVWTAGEFVALANTGESLQYFDNGMVGSGNWTSAPATPDAENATPMVEPADVVINEFDADQTDTDAMEFVELYSATGGTSLDGHVLVFFNGSDNASYQAFDLDGFSIGADGYFVLCGDATMVDNCDYDVSVPTNLIQNGADAIALFVGDATDFPEDTPVTTENLVDAVVYGTSDDDDPELLVLLNEGQSQIDEGANGASFSESNQRIPNGAGGARNTDAFMQLTPTPGTENGAAPALVTGIRINEISHGEIEFMGATNWVELYNANDSEVDVSSLILCDFPTYSVISSLTVLSGSTTMPAGGYLVLNWANLDDEDAEVGLYQANATGDFGNADLMIDYMQYGTADHQRESVAVDAGLWTVDEFVELADTGESLQFFENGMVGAGNWASAPSTAGEANEEPVVVVTDIRINEVSHGEVDFMGSTNWVELYNAGDSETDVSSLILCDFPTYTVISSLTVLAGNTTIPAGGYLVLEWANLDDDAEVGLYQANATGNFGSADLMIDYMQYGSANHQREPVAVTAGLWTANEFVELANTGESLQYFDNGTVGSGNWASAPATPDAENEEPETSITDIRINEVSHGEVNFMGATNWVELYNAGNTEADVSNLFLCDFPTYTVISTLNVLAGSTTIPAGGYLVLEWANIDNDAEVGLYQANAAGDFGNSDLMIDYMQYGSAGHQREGVAVNAGLWVADEFVELSLTGESLQYFESNGVGASNWSSSPATAGEANVLVLTSSEAFDLPTEFQLHGNYPNPFNPTTTITYDISDAGQVTLKVFSVLGREVATLVDGVLPIGSYKTAWDGKNTQGEIVPSGTYLYRLTYSNGKSQSRIMTLLK